jgi:hypothetical protein
MPTGATARISTGTHPAIAQAREAADCSRNSATVPAVLVGAPGTRRGPTGRHPELKWIPNPVCATVNWTGYPILGGPQAKGISDDGTARRPVSLVTGANKGIGLEAVGRLAGAGHRVYLAARDAGRGRAAAEAIGARFVQLDVTSDDSARRAAVVVEQVEGRLDVLVNNADITEPLRDVHDYEGGDMAAVLLTVRYAQLLPPSGSTARTPE